MTEIFLQIILYVYVVYSSGVHRLEKPIHAGRGLGGENFERKKHSKSFIGLWRSRDEIKSWKV